MIRECISKSGISKLFSIKHNFKKNELFDNRALDKEIENFALQLNFKKQEKKLEQNNVLFLVTELYNHGGHSALIKNILQNIPEKFNTKLFLTKKNKSAKIANYTKIDGVNFTFLNEKKLLAQMFNKIIDFSPKTIFTFIHMNDAFAVAILALLKKHTSIKILFVNFAAHHPCLGMTFADLILETSPANAFVTQKYRGFANTYVMWLVGETKEQISNTKAKLEIPENFLCSMTGCASYKLMLGNSSPFLEVIYKLLKKHETLCHVLITNLNKELKHIIDSIFENYNIRKRLILLDFATDYKSLFKCADIFIDTFPISNDLTTIDLMSLRIPFVCMVNRENIIQSFNEYVPQNYPYIFDNIEDVEHGAEKLLLDKHEQGKVAEMNYEHFLRFF
jgi:hypothetical protein